MSTCGDCQECDAINVLPPICRICRVSGREVDADRPACPPRRRELEALAEAERLKKENEQLHIKQEHLRHRMRLIGGN